MVALLCIQAVIQYHFDVFGIVETATAVKNKNDSIQAVQKQNLFPLTYSQCFKHKLYSSSLKMQSKKMLPPFLQRTDTYP